MLRILFLILVVMSSVAFAQIQEEPKAYKFFECGKISKNLLEDKFADFYKELKKDDSQGYIINYGKLKDVAKREIIIRNSISFRDDDAPRITLVNGGDIGELKTVFWIVPVGAETPIP